MKNLRSCTAGAVAVVSALVFPVLLGFTSLGVEVGHWYLAQRQMQGAADAAAISAAAQYIQDTNNGNPASTAYQTVGTRYALTNGFTIPTANVCLFTLSGDNCGSVRALDARTIVCSTPPCVVVEITQNTMQWLTTKASMDTNGLGRVRAIPAPTLLARAIVTAKSTTQTTTTPGTDCVLALANDKQAIIVHGNKASITANCGLAVDGGRDQNVNGTPVGGISLNGGAKVNISSLVIAGPPSSTICPDGGAQCRQYNGTPLPAAAVHTNTPTLDPYASMVFPTPPSGPCVTWTGTAVSGKKYCSINISGGTTNFPAGNYFIAGGCFCVSGNNTIVTSDAAGVTFYLTNNNGGATYATIGITSGTVSLCAPGTGCGTGCTGSCVLFFQDPAAPASSGDGIPTNTVNSFAGNGTRTLSGLMYLPRQTAQFLGSSGVGGCFGLVAKYVDDGGNPTFSDGCLPGNGIGGTTTTVTNLTDPYLYQ